MNTLNTRLSGTLVLCILAVAPARAQKGAEPLPEKYREIAHKVISAALADENSTARLEYLCDRIGHRVSGSPSLERAIEWSASEMKEAGLVNVQTPPVKVPRWVRGKERASLVEPIQKPLVMFGFGMSVGTPPEGVIGEVLPVENPSSLQGIARDRIAGKIVLYTLSSENTYLSPGYKQAVSVGPSTAAALGASAVLIRDSFSLQNPRTTGLAPYAEGVPKIPAAGISMEDAFLINRLAARGSPVRVHLMMEAHTGPDANSHNVMGEFRGREKPEEIVVLGGHIDTWDVGQGANDDGSGIMASLEAVLLLKRLGLQPRRTLRVVFWVNEENGGAGGRAYRTMIGDAVKDHVAAIEMDHGAEKTVGFGFGAADQDKLTPGAFHRAEEIGELLRPIGGGKISPKGGGGDIRPLTADGVPGFAAQTVDVNYASWTHTFADTFDKIVPREFREHVASLAVLGYVLADMPERLSQMK
jgi:hypothetical protein